MKINTASGTTSATMTQGNTYNGLSLDATQDINGNDPTHFKFYGSIINADANATIDNATQVINLPSTADGKSGFTPVLTGAVTLTDPNTRTDLANAATITYYTDRADLDKGADSLAGKTGLTANQVTDWSNIKAIKVVFNKQPLEKQTTARVTMSMVDNNIYDHVGKTIYASSVIYSTNNQGDTPLQKVVINPGTLASAKLTVIGKSKLKTIVHYTDDNGADHYVELPDKLVTYNDGTNMMKRTDFLSKDSDLTSNDHLLLPEHMDLDYVHPTIKNSDATYLNNYPNDIAEFGQPVKYDFDGDAVVFEGKVAKKVTQSHQVKETVHYVKTDGSKISDDVVKKSKEFKDVGYQNPFTGEIKWSATGETDTLPAISSPEITGYTPDTTSIPEQVVNVGTPDIDKKVTYSPDPQSVVYRFVDDDNKDQQVGQDITKNGVTDQTLNYNSGTFTVPTGYELVGKLPTSYTFKASGNDPIDIHLKHPTTRVSKPENWPTDLIGTKVDLTHSTTRTIEYWDKDSNTKILAGSLPTGVSQDAQQTVTFGRTAIVDNITHKIVRYVDPSDSTKTITDGDNAWQVTSIDKDWAAKDNPTVDHYNGPFEEDGTTTYSKVSEQTPTTNTNDQTVKVYYTHKITTITGKTDKYKDPVGHDLTDADFSKTITRTINIVDDKGQTVKSIPQQVTFTRNATVDEVTGQVTAYGNWQAKDRNNSWDKYLPTIGNGKDIPAGYHISSIQSGNQDYSAVTKDSQGKLTGVERVDQVVGTNVDPTTVSDVTVNIHYAPDDQKITYQIIDDTDGTGNKAVTDLPNGAGVTNGDIPATAKSSYREIKQELQHSDYEIVSADEIDNKFGSSTTNLTIHVKHGTTKVSDPKNWPTTTKDQDKVDLSKTVTRNINYIDATNNRPMPSALAPTQEQTATLTRTAIVDKVTGKIINYVDPADPTKTIANGDDAWSTGTWEVVTNPDLTNKGYNGPFSDENGKSQAPTVDGSKVSISTNTDPINIYYTHKTITVTKPTDSSKALPDNPDKNYPTINDADLTKTVTRRIYIQGNTTPVATQQVTFNREATIDEVTGEVEYSDWTTANNAWGSYIPTIGDNKDIPTGYHISSIKSGDQGYSTVTKDDHGNLTGVGEVDTVVKKRKDGKFDPTRATDIDVTINYEADKQKIHIVYQDSDDHDKEIKRTDLTGVTDGTSQWNAAIPSNYELAKGQVDHGDYKFKGENNSDIIVKLSHKHQAGNDQRNVTREIIVNVPGKDSETITRSVNAKRTSDQDLVTGKTTYGQWQVDQLPEYTAPVVPGYTPTQRKVEKLTVVDKNGKLIKPTKVVINYAPDKQKLTVDFIDDANNGKILKTFTKDGKSDERANYSTADDLKSFKKQHYDVASDSTNGKQLVFDHDDQTDQHYEVHLIHHLTPINDHREVNETVHYQYADGSAAHNDYKATPLEFNRTGERDEVTGTDSWNAWIPGSLSFSKIDSPKIQGYTPNEKAIDVTPVDANSKDVVRTVTYAPDAQTVHYQFVDDDNKDQNGNPTQVGSDVVKNGKTDQTITYHDGDFIIPAGYELVSVLPTSYKFKASGNNPIDIHLKHKVIVITPNDPKQSTDKLPDNPNKNYPTGVSQNDLNETIKRQITVVRPGGSTIDASQLITLTRTATVDEVTGKVIKYSDWTTGSLAEYDAPKISGYTPSRNAPAVEVVKHGDRFAPIKITYIVISSDTDNTKPSDYPGNTPSISQSSSKEAGDVPDEKDTKLREIKEHKSIKPIDKTPRQIHITKHIDKNYQSNIATLAQDMKDEERQSNVAIDLDVGKAKRMVDEKVESNNVSTKQTLPQTGQKSDELGLIGLSATVLGALTALLGTMIDRKRK